MEEALEDEFEEEDGEFPLAELLFEVPDGENEAVLACFDKSGLNKENWAPPPCLMLGANNFITSWQTFSFRRNANSSCYKEKAQM